MERLTEWVGSGPDRKAIARQDRRDIGDKDCVARLATYEDTGLTPDAVAQLKQIAEIFNCDSNDPAQLKQLCDKLRGWQQADQTGRLVVLPCKVGDTVYRVASICTWPEAECPDDSHSCSGCRELRFEVVREKIENVGEAFIAVQYWGRTIFATRQEAEAAVEREKGGVDDA